MPKSAPAEPVAPAPETFLCPTCGVTTTYRCGTCDATVHVDLKGRVIWMLNGRVVPGSIQESRIQAYIHAATRHRIPVDQWPEQYRELGAAEMKEEE